MIEDSFRSCQGPFTRTPSHRVIMLTHRSGTPSARDGQHEAVARLVFRARSDLADTRYERASTLRFATIRASCAQAAVCRAPGQDAAASAAWHPWRGLSGLPTAHGKGNGFCASSFPSETADNGWPFLDEKPKKRIRAFPKRINQMAASAAAAKVELMEARPGRGEENGERGPGGITHQTPSRTAQTLTSTFRDIVHA